MNNDNDDILNYRFVHDVTFVSDKALLKCSVVREQLKGGKTE